MDTLTHGLAGSVLARTAASRPGARGALVTGMAAAMLPDLDILFLHSQLDYLRFHRGWTHSFLVLPFFALGVALAVRLVFRQARLSTLWLFAAIGIASHILFDWITSFGTMFFFPLSRARYSLDWVFILDPVFTGIVAAALLAAALFRRRGREVAAAGGLLLIGYIGFCGVLHARALEEWRRRDRPGDGVRVAVLPQFLSPFRWLGLAEHPDSIHVAFFDIGPFARGAAEPRPPERFSEVLRSLSDFYPPPERMRVRRYAQPPPSSALEAARALPDVDAYLRFARFPLAKLMAEPDGGTLIVWEDLRFLPWFAGPWEIDRNLVLRRRPFLYRVRLDAAGRTLESHVVDSFHIP